jgi:exonuclease SbcC
MRATKLTIENFQSHENTVIDLSPGVTVLVGESDRGKSAVIRALRWLVLGEPKGAGFVRAGETRCKVRLDYDTGDYVERIKSPRDNVYLCNDSAYRGFGNTPPLEIQEITGVAKSDVAGEPVCANIAGQHDPPFLLGMPNTAKAQIIGTLGGADVFDAALRGTMTDATRARRDAARLEEEIGALNIEIVGLAWVEELRAAIDETASAMEQVAQDTSRRDKIAALLTELITTCDSEDELSQILIAAQGGETAAALVEECDNLMSRSCRIMQLYQEREALREVIVTMESILAATEGMPTVEEIVEIGGMKARETRLRRLVEERRGVNDEIQGYLRALSALSEVYDCFYLLDQIDVMWLRRARVQRAVTQSQVVKRDHEAAINEAVKRGIELSEIEGSMREIFVALGRCPVCMSEIGAEAAERAVAGIIGSSNILLKGAGIDEPEKQRIQ